MTRRYNNLGELEPEGFIRASELFPRKGEWSGNNKLGAAVELETVGDNYMLLKTDEWWMPHAWSLSLWSTPRRRELDNPIIGTTEATVDFGAGGAMQSVKVDFRRGTVLTLVTNSISVKITRVSADSRIFAQVCLGTRGACGCPKKQVFRNLLVPAGADGPGFLVPDFTEDLLILRGAAGNILAPDVFVEVSNKLSFLDIIESVPLSVITGNYSGHVPLDSDGVSFRISNQSAADIRLSAVARIGL